MFKKLGAQKTIPAILTTVLLVVGGVIVIGKPGSDRTQEIFTIQSECSSGPNSYVTKYLCSNIPLLLTSNDYLSTSLIRNFVHEEIIRFANTKVFQKSPSFEFRIEYEAEEYFNIFQENQKGALCGATADFLKSIYKAFGLNSYTYNFGAAPGSHVVTLVEIQNKLYLQDAYFNYTLSKLAKKMTPIPISEVLNRFNSRTGEIDLYLNQGVAIQRSKTMQQIFVEQIGMVCEEAQIVEPGLKVCRVPSRRLSDLEDDVRFLNPLKESSLSLAKAKNSAKFLYALKSPIGNEPKINCLVTKEACGSLWLKEMLSRVRWLISYALNR